MLVRMQTAAAAVVMACLCSGRAPVDAQVVEPDAPERAIAGCYSTHPAADFPLVDPLPGREDRFQLPDTINLTLQLRRVGWSFGGSIDWRQTGHFLGLDPALLSPGGLHRSDAWRLTADGFSLGWSGGYPDPSSISLTLNTREQGGAWRGTATLVVGGQRYVTEVALRPVDCPSPEYWRAQRTRLMNRWAPISDVDVEVGEPIVSPPDADIVSPQPPN